ncbi:MAG: T9SS type A sorting domain-containing protein, partial [Ginsengibacter sp.]
LKETDKDGKVTYSSIIDIHQSLSTSLHIFPNPAINRCVIYFNGVAAKNSVLKIFDINGKKQRQILLDTKQSSVTIDVSSFSAGTYFCTLQVAGKMFTQKLIVVK